MITTHLIRDDLIKSAFRHPSALRVMHGQNEKPADVTVEAASADFLLQVCKKEAVEGERFTVPLWLHSFFFPPRFALPALWLNAAENWPAWQSRGGCFP